MLSRLPNASHRTHVAAVFDTRPELIKLGPVIRTLQRSAARVTVVNTGQHSDLLIPLLRLFGIKPDHDLAVMQTGQSLNQLDARLLASLDQVLENEDPDAVLVQGDTASAAMGGLAAFNRQIPVGHVEAGLRSGIPDNPFPEEMNRRLIGQLATWHYASTERNRQTLLSEGVSASQVFVNGNPVIDALFSDPRSHGTG
jgi:UDP-N-acetylglucosamine 2-epimerase (non-hydrolysing)